MLPEFNKRWCLRNIYCNKIMFACSTINSLFILMTTNGTLMQIIRIYLVHQTFPIHKRAFTLCTCTVALFYLLLLLFYCML